MLPDLANVPAPGHSGMLLAVMALAAGFFGACAIGGQAAPTTPPALPSESHSTAQIPVLGHTFIIMVEGEAYSSPIGSPKASSIDQPATTYGNAGLRLFPLIMYARRLHHGG